MRPTPDIPANLRPLAAGLRRRDAGRQWKTRLGVLCTVLGFGLLACNQQADIDGAAVATIGGEASCPGWQFEGVWVRDLRTGLLWERYVELQGADHKAAQARCSERGARLPTRKEVEALRAPSAGDACQLPACAFRGARCAVIQCGSGIGTSTMHWGVAMGSGGLVSVGADEQQGVLCVRTR